MSRQFLRLCQSTPLPSLSQGGTLSIKSSFHQKLRVAVVPQWRVGGRIFLEQTLASSPTAQASVVQETDLLTSMGRVESHVSVHVGPKQNVADTASSVSASSEDTPEPDLQEEATAPDKECASRGDNKSFLDSPLTLTAVIPEKVNLKCDLPNGGSISIENKIEGDVHLVTSDGDVRVKKLRGHRIRILAQGSGSTIYTSDVIEAQQVDLSTNGRVRAKQIHGKEISINVGDWADHSDAPLTMIDEDDEGSVVDIGSLYISRDGDANVVVAKTGKQWQDRRAVRVKSSHGHVSVLTSTWRNGNNKIPLVELGGVTGSCDVSMHLAESKDDTMPKPLAGQVHFDSLSPGSVSVVTADKGDISVTFDRKLNADLRLVSSPNIASIDARTTLVEDDKPEEIVNALNQLQDSIARNFSSPSLEGGDILIQTSAFTKRPPLHSGSDDKSGITKYVEGWIENKSDEPDSRFDVKNRGEGGKIRLDGAAAQALQGFARSGVSTEDCTRSLEEDYRPLVVVATDGTLVVETLSWLGSIARRYGLDES